MKNREILSNEINNIEFNYKLINRDFQCIGVKDIKDCNYYKLKVNINKIFTPLATIENNNNRLYTTLLLLKKEQKIIKHDSILYKNFNFDEIATCDLAALIIRATPYILNESNYFSYEDKLHTPIEPKKITKGYLVKCHEIDIIEHDSRCLLKVSGATFTPKHWHKPTQKHEITMGKYFKKVGDTVYIKRGVKKEKQTYTSLDINTYDKFRTTKVHTISALLENLSKNKYMHFSLKHLRGELTHYNQEIKSQKKAIKEYLNQYGIAVFNITSNDKITKLVTNSLEADGLTIKDSANSPTIIIGYSKKTYKDKKIIDPKEIYKNKFISSQYVDIETLLVNGIVNNIVLSVLVNELYIKHQNAKGKIEAASNLENVGVYLYDEKSESLDCLLIKSGKCVFDTISDAELIQFDLGIAYEADYSKPLIIDWQKNLYYNFSDTSMVALPEFETIDYALKEKQKATRCGVDKHIIIEYLNILRDKIPKKDTNILIDKLELILEDSSSSVITEKSLKSIANKGKENQLFYTWLYEKYDIHLKPRLKGEKDGNLNAYLGTFFDNKTNMYFSGAPKNPDSKFERYCVVRKIETNDKVVPKWILTSMRHFYVRNKQATVMPFLFKHLREWKLMVE